MISINRVYFRQEAVPTTRNRLDEARAFRRVAECIPKLINGLVKAVVKVDECVPQPQFVLKLFSADDFARMLQ